MRRHLDSRILRREDEHDILQSMFASFCHGQSMGKTPPCSRHELWKLLVRITMCKVVNTAHRHTAICRDVRKERSHRRAGPETWESDWIEDQVDRGQARPDDRASVVEEVERLLNLLPQDLRQIVIWKIEGFTNAEISQKIGRTVRSSSSSFNSSGRCSRKNSRLLFPRSIWSPRRGFGRCFRESFAE